MLTYRYSFLNTNYQLINRALVITAPMCRDEDRGNHEERIEHRKALKKRLLIYFGSGLICNFINLSSFIIGGFVYKQYFVEILIFTGCAVTAYLILNLYFLDVLRDGVLNPIIKSVGQENIGLMEMDSYAHRGPRA
jgi:hypothetical protein